MIDRPIRTPESAGVNVICHATATFGLAVAARNTIRTLDDAGIPVAIIDVDSRDGRSGRVHTYSTRLTTEAPYPVNLFHLNPPEIVRLIQTRPSWLDVTTKVNASVPFWELPRVPAGWAPLLEAMDIVLAPTRYVRDAVQAGTTGVDCRHFPQAVYLPAGIRPDRARLGLPGESTNFLLAFDLTSDVDRKNPYAALRAFDNSGLTCDEARLVIKLSGTDYSRSTRAAADELRQRIRQDARIVLIDEPLSYRDMLAVAASCDVLVSLHRSEGLGLNILEAMSEGRPAIVTSWSGNMDFTTAENSCLVPFDLVPVASAHRSYRPGAIGSGQRWAEPDVNAAAACMRRLATDSELRHAMGERARRDMERLRTDPARLNPIEDVLSESAAIVQGVEHVHRTAQLQAMRQVPLITRARRTAVAALRALGVRR